MSSKEIAKILINRAEKFLYYANESFKKDDYNFTVLFSEQAVQLLLKAKVIDAIGEVPKTHSLKYLISLLEKIYKVSFKKLIRNKSIIMDELEHAYIASRYLPEEYSKDTAKHVLNFAKEVFEFVKRI